MRLNKLYPYGIGALAALSAGIANALPNNATAVDVLMSGATATDESLEDLFLLKAGGICEPTGAGVNQRIDIYRGASGAAGGGRLIVCPAATEVGLGAVNIAFRKESGGSGSGTNNVGAQTNVTVLNRNSGAFACTAGPTLVTDATGTFHDYFNWTGCTPTQATPPAAGIADVEPQLLGATTATINNLNTFGLLQVVFGPAVSLNLYRALQTAQGLTTNDLAANIPSLTSPQLRAIFNGQVGGWSTFTSLNGTPLSNADDTPYICMRGNSSGTQATFKTQLSRQGLADSVGKGIDTFVKPDSITCGDNAAGAIPGVVWGTDNLTSCGVFAGTGTGDVKRCLDAHHDDGDWAIGVVSTEGIYNVGDAVATHENPIPTTIVEAQPDEWRWITVDGQAPTLESVANGCYDFFTENVINAHKTALTGSPLTVVTYIRNNLGLPDILKGVNVDHRNTHGDGGLLAIPNGGTITPDAPPITAGDLRLKPISTQRRTLDFDAPAAKVDSWSIFSTIAGGGCPSTNNQATTP